MNSPLADAIVCIHFTWIGYVVFGQLAILLGILLGWEWIRNFWFRFTHLSMMLLVFVEVLYQIQCPLTIWEQALCEPGALYGNRSFIVERLRPICFFELDHDAWQFFVGYLTFTVLVVWSTWIRPPRMKSSTATFVGHVHAFIGAILLATAWTPRDDVFLRDQFVGLCFLIQAALWYGVQFVKRPTWPVTPSTLVALVHLAIGVAWLGFAWPAWGIGVCFLVQAIAWYGLQSRST